MIPSGLYQSPVLSKLAFATKNKAYIAEDIFKPVAVPFPQGRYLIWDTDVVFRRQNTKMSMYASANMIDVNAVQAPFMLETHALKVYLDEQERAIADAAGVQLRSIKTAALANSMRLDFEVDIANTLRDPAVLTQNTTLSGTAQWSDPASDPKSLFLTTSTNMLVQPNTLIVGRPVWNALMLHPRLIEAVKYSQGAVDTSQIVARYLGIDRVLIGDALQNIAAKGQAANNQAIWGKDAILCHIAPGQPTAMMDEPSLGYLPVWNGGGGEGPGGMWRTYIGRDAEMGTGIGAEMIKVECTYKPLLSAPQYAWLFKNAVA